MYFTEFTVPLVGVYNLVIIFKDMERAFFIIYFMQMGVLPLSLSLLCVCVCVYHVHAVLREARRP